MFDLKAIRKAAGLTQIQLSQRAHVSRFRLSLAEAGSLDLRPEEVTALVTTIKPELDKAACAAAQFEHALSTEFRPATRKHDD